MSRRLVCSSLLGGLLRQEHSLDVRQDTALSDGDSGQQLVQLLVVADSQLEMARIDPCLLVVSGSVASQFQDFGSQILEHGSQINGGTGTDTFRVISLSK